jgi:hypothetical protein
VAIEYTNQEAAALLRVAHKYCMDIFEGAAIEQLERASTIDEHVELILASQLLSSEEMYEQTLKQLARYWLAITLEQAQKIGTKAYYELTWHYRMVCDDCGADNSSMVRCDCGQGR